MHIYLYSTRIMCDSLEPKCAELRTLYTVVHQRVP